MGNCKKCEKSPPVKLAEYRTIKDSGVAKLEPRGAANDPRIIIKFNFRQGVTYQVENADPGDAYDLLQGCWLAAGEMFKLLGESRLVHPPKK